MSASSDDVVARFNAAHPEYKVNAVRVADYTALFRKVRATIHGGDLPDLCVAYESMVAEFMAAESAEPEAEPGFEAQKATGEAS